MSGRLKSPIMITSSLDPFKIREQVDILLHYCIQRYVSQTDMSLILKLFFTVMISTFR